MDRFPLRRIFNRKERSAQHYVQGDRPLKDATVLVVDDSRTMVHALRIFLESAGYFTIGALDGVQAVQAAQLRKPDLVLMDIVMPNMNGFEATRRLSRDPATSRIPIIIVSGSERATDRAWGLRMGAKGYLAKPIRKESLLSTVDAVLSEARRRAEARQERLRAITTPGPARRTLWIAAG
jgi:twitching motility two-component system response regulator PilH